MNEESSDEMMVDERWEWDTQQQIVVERKMCLTRFGVVQIWMMCVRVCPHVSSEKGLRKMPRTFRISD